MLFFVRKNLSSKCCRWIAIGWLTFFEKRRSPRKKSIKKYERSEQYSKIAYLVMKNEIAAASGGAGEPKARPDASLLRSEINQFLPASRFIAESGLKVWKSTRTAREFFFFDRFWSYSAGNTHVTKRGKAFLRSTQSSIARDCERELTAASRGAAYASSKWTTA